MPTNQNRPAITSETIRKFFELNSLPEVGGFEEVIYVISEKKFYVFSNNTWQAISGGTGSGTSDHGELTGLSDDDHPQYFNSARLDAIINTTLVEGEGITLDHNTEASTLTISATGGGGGGAATGPYVLRVEGGSHVDHGKFWPDGSTFTDDLGKFVWDAWVVHLEGEYLISDGYGGAHALLWGFAGTGAAVTGNVFNGTGNTSFASKYAPGPEEWLHMAVAWNGTNRIGVFINGICDGIFAFAGPRRAVSVNPGGGGNLYVCGSDHSRGSYKLAMIRGFDLNKCPFAGFTQPFVPERHPSRIYDTDTYCDFFADYTISRGNTIYDSSPCGYPTIVGQKVFHHGRMKNPDGGMGEAFSSVPSIGTLPIWEYDSTCPYGQNLGDSPAPIEVVRTPAVPPVGCLVYDSFERSNQTLAFQRTPSLGSTEAGSLGPLVWSTGRITGSGNAVFGTFGILGGDAICTSNGTVVGWVPVGTANQDIVVKVSTFSGHPGTAGIAFRLVDANNYLSMYYTADAFQASNGTSKAYGGLYLTKIEAGVLTSIAGYSTSTGTFTHIRVKVVGNTVTTYYGNPSAWTTAGSATISTFNTAQNAGITNANTYINTIDVLARWVDFTVYTGT